MGSAKKPEVPASVFEKIFDGPDSTFGRIFDGPDSAFGKLFGSADCESTTATRVSSSKTIPLPVVRVRLGQRQMDKLATGEEVTYRFGDQTLIISNEKPD
jgi:hypothetical protein